MNITADGGIWASLPESGTASLGVPAVALISNATTAMLRSPITLTASVSSTGVSPSGSVSFVEGSTVLGTAALSNGTASLLTASLAAGAHTIYALYSGDANFQNASSSTLVSTVLDFTLAPAASPGASQTVGPGGSAAYLVTITPTAGTSFPISAVLTVSGLPQGATATLNTSPWTQLTATSWQVPATTTLSNVSLTIHLPTQTVASANSSSRYFPGVVWGVLLLPFIRKLRCAGKRIASVFAGLLVLACSLSILTGLSGCGVHNGFYGQAPQSYTVTVALTAGTVSHSTDLTLNVH
jgi:hypothetical protein